MTSSVPDLEFNGLVLDFDGFGTELYTDGDVVREPSLVLYELKHHTRLAYSGVPDDDELEQVVVRVHF